MPRQKVIDYQFSLLHSGPYAPIPGGPQLPYTMVGTQLDDTLIGGRGNDVIGALGGEDLVHGQAGHDWITGGRGRDLLFGDVGNDHIYGEEGEDIIDGGDGNDVMYGGANNDSGWGGAGNDSLYGEAGDDNIGGGDGNDIVDGGDGDDNVEGNLGDDKIYGGAGNDILDDNQEFDGSGGHDWYYGGAGNDRLITKDIADTLDMNLADGGTGFDRLEMATDGVISNIGSLANVTNGIEAIGLAYAWDATLIVNPQDVLDFSDNDILFITGAHDDTWPFDAATNNVDSTSNAWTATGTLAAFGNVFTHYEATVNGQHADLYVDTWLNQTGVTA